MLVYRGLPSPQHDEKPYGRNLAQQTEWERDARVSVNLRPLKYSYQQDADGNKVCDENGVATVTGKDEKGVDVLCALVVVREARRPDIGLVILASQDTDLEPALDEALTINKARIETASWFDALNRSSRELRPAGDRKIWNTRLNASDFAAVQNLKPY